MNAIRKITPVVVLPLALLVGCAPSQFTKDCEAEGGSVSSSREKCGTGTRTKTTGTGTSKRTTTETYSKYKTEYECMVDGEEIAEHETSCS